jgi:hypothetical protein
MIQLIKAKPSGWQQIRPKWQIADPPIQMEGTDYLIHPVADLRVYERGTKSEIWSFFSVIDLSFIDLNYGEK